MNSTSALPLYSLDVLGMFVCLFVCKFVVNHRSNHFILLKSFCFDLMAEKKSLRSGLALVIIDDCNRSKHGQGQALLYKNVKLT